MNNTDIIILSDNGQPFGILEIDKSVIDDQFLESIKGKTFSEIPKFLFQKYEDTWFRIRTGLQVIELKC